MLRAGVVSEPPPVGGDSSVLAVVEARNLFTLDLYGRFKQTEGNIFYSGDSVHSALTSTLAGARGETASQMRRALHYELEGQALHSAAGRLQRTIESHDQISIANRLWLQKGFPLLPAFLRLSEASYGATPEELDFTHDAEGSRRTINAWVEGRTNRRIKELIQSSDLEGDARLVLTNATAFIGGWAARFEKGRTRTEEFTLDSGQTVPVAMMRRTGRIAYADGGDCHVVELPYEGGEISMLVIVPKEVDGLAGVEAAFSTSKINAWVEALGPRELVLALPRFRIHTSTISLGEELQALGMVDAFTPRADFSGMTSAGGLYISKVLHKAFVEVDEDGTEAAAATAVVMTKSAPPLRLIVRADRPFLFIIRHRGTGCLLFVGRLAAPTSEASE